MERRSLTSQNFGLGVVSACEQLEQHRRGAFPKRSLALRQPPAAFRLTSSVPAAKPCGNAVATAASDIPMGAWSRSPVPQECRYWALDSTFLPDGLWPTPHAGTPVGKPRHQSASADFSLGARDFQSPGPPRAKQSKTGQRFRAIRFRHERLC